MSTNPIIKAPDHDRYKYLLEKAVEAKEVWLLQAYDGMYAMFEDDKEQTYIPVWPEKLFAQDYAQDDWEGYNAVRMGLGEFLNWLPELKEDLIKIGAFPNADLQALSADPVDLRNHIMAMQNQE